MSNELFPLIAAEMNILRKHVAATVRLLDDGATIPFISRYRKEATGGLDEVAVLAIKQRYDSLCAMLKRKELIISTIEEQGKLTPELRARIEETMDMSQLEDLYMPFKPRRRTRAVMAIERGLEPLARMLMSQTHTDIQRSAKKFVEGEVSSVDDAIAGAQDIVAEWMSESEKARSIVRSRYQRNATITSKVVKGKEEDGKNYENYFDFSSPLRSITSHRLLAMLRGEKEGCLKINVAIDDDEMIERLSRLFLKATATEESAKLLRATVKDSYRRLIRPSIESEVMDMAKQRADESAIAMFADNVRQLLLAAPLGRKRVLAIDPGFRTGCKVVCLDESGMLLFHDVIYPTPPTNDFHGAAFKVCRLVENFGIEAIAIGNGTAGRETEQFISQLRFPVKVAVFVVSESGASIYSASKVAREEFPDHDVTVRGAVSIGRRLLDPLAELVKIEPRSIGVGQYQHDVDQTKLKDALNYTVESCVNSVGVNVNTASRELLSYVSGIGPSLAGNIVAHRTEHGYFRNRQQLMDVTRMGEKAFQQCAGFLRIPDGDNILDNTAVHPERYELIHQMAADYGCNIDSLVSNPRLLHELDLSRYVDKQVGLPTLTDIVTELEKPGRDPRATAEATAFDDRVRDIRDLVPGMELNGVVNNLTAFGCFVDIGLHENGLVHISQLCDRFVSNPADVVAINRRVRVRVMDVDYVRGRIALTMKGVAQE